MIGEGRVKLADSNTDPYELIVNFLSLSNSSKDVAAKKANEIFARKGSNRLVMSDKTVNEIREGNAISGLDSIKSEVSENTIKQICGCISELTDYMKRRCAIGYFMAKGTTLKYRTSFQLSTNTDNLQRNLENEKLNEEISRFNDKQDEKWFKAIIKRDEFISTLPPDVQKHYNEKYDGFFDPGKNEVGNIRRDISKQWSLHPELTEEDRQEFEDVIAEYRKAYSLHNKPEFKEVAVFLGVDDKALTRTSTQIVGSILQMLPGVTVARIIEGD